MSILKKVKSWISKIIDSWKRNDVERRNKNLEQEVRDLLQIMEFHGKLYVSYRDIPIVCTDDLKAPAVDILRNSRKSLMEWRKR